MIKIPLSIDVLVADPNVQYTFGRYASPGCDYEVNNEIDLGVHLAKVHQKPAKQRGVQQRIAVDDTYAARRSGRETRRCGGT